MRAGARDFERALDGELAAHFPEVNVVVAAGLGQRRPFDLRGARPAAVAQRRDEFDRRAQSRDAEHVDARDDRRLGRVLLGQNQTLDSGVARAYEGLIDGIVADEPPVRGPGPPALETDTLMDTPESRRRVAARTLEFAGTLRR